ncbi:MAG: hypothetical protein ACFCU2_11425 [Acidimicrobiia bacterium]
MRSRSVLVLALTGLLLIAACGDTDLTETTFESGTVTTGDPTGGDDVVNDIATTVAAVQAEVNELSTEVQNSAAAAELEGAWNALQAEVLAAVAAIRDDGTIDGSSLQEEVDAFQTQLDSLGDEVEPALMDAWQTLRDRLQSLMS